MKPSFKIALLASFALLTASEASQGVQSSASPKTSNRLHIEIEDLDQSNLSQDSTFNKDSDRNQDYDSDRNQDYDSDRNQDYDSDRNQDYDYNYDHDAKNRSNRGRLRRTKS